MVNKINKDILIAGDGIVANLLIHLLGKNNFNTYQVSKKSKKSYNRFFAITPANYLWLITVGLDQDILSQAHPIKKIKLFEGHSNQSIHMDAIESNKNILAYMIQESDLVDAISKLNSKAKTINVINNIENKFDQIKLGGEKYKNFDLCIFTDQQRKQDLETNFEFHKKEFNQTAITFNLKFAVGSDDTAYQFFFDDSTLAILPFSKDEVSIVWSCQNKLHKELQEKSRNEFLEIFLARTNYLYKPVAGITNQTSFPLSMSVSDTLHTKRFLIMGDAAHKIHPMAGQGLNLGLRDLRAFQLALSERKSDDIGLNSFLKKYQRKRLRDIKEFSFLTNQLNNLFLNDNDYIKKLIAKGFAFIDKSKFIKSILINRATS
ncbi:MAG: FAD-dependent monooxygenase [Proteobacteria bacterium]|nr:FAD-dependent monooxygenase [Pseudomonadota bacterium]MDA1133440.1 FAD-dependent monooxygenase [Pseudomonadota bacterium]